MKIYKRSCRKCGFRIDLSVKDDGRIITCKECGHFMKLIETRLCNTVSDLEIVSCLSKEHLKL